MTEWRQKSECPEPDRWFVRELKKIDPELRVEWALHRYLRNTWAIERRTDPTRYFEMYSALLSDNGPRFVEQPIFDNDQPIKDLNGVPTGAYVQLGTRQYDLAPEYEWVAFRPVLDQSLLDLIKKLYWERDHPQETQAAVAQEQADRETAHEKKLDTAITEGIKEAFLETRKVVQFGRGKKRNET